MSQDMMEKMDRYLETASPCEILHFIGKLREVRPELTGLVAKAATLKRQNA